MLQCVVALYHMKGCRDGPAWAGGKGWTSGNVVHCICSSRAWPQEVEEQIVLLPVVLLHHQKVVSRPEGLTGAHSAAASDVLHATAISGRETLHSHSFGLQGHQWN